ncbi:uncharacterized protein LOC111377941 [Olea europaea var. sylvestris]|uniref:uncharacterized protein LOC111377941 n=1 Tax=Olea europaea var. sylvestris TaxID=158386 RepID=UPI000C1CE2DE|nr:uncharacterized protein LOC111377941 [Olea europaea var. sylvestris]
MEIKPSPAAVIAKKLWHIIKTILYIMRKGISKSKLMFDLHMILKRGKIASKAIGNLRLHHNYSTFTCQSDEVLTSFISPGEYEFSCSNSPVKLKNPLHRHSRYQVAEEKRLARKVGDILNHCEMVESSPLTTLPGFGCSPLVRQLRVSDSPFPLQDAEENNHQVDKDAEEFINKFYKNLKQQKRMAASESPSLYHI